MIRSPNSEFKSYTIYSNTLFRCQKFQILHESTLDISLWDFSDSLFIFCLANAQFLFVLIDILSEKNNFFAFFGIILLSTIILAYNSIYFFLGATKHLYNWLCPLVCWSVGR